MPKVVPQYKEQARKRIIKAATAEFAKKGYRNVTMNDVAEKVGVSKAAVYHYFNSKQSLVAAIAASLLESAVEGEISRREDQSFLEAAEGSFGRLLKSMPGLLPGLPFEVIAEAQRDRGARDTSVGLESALAEALSKSWDTCRGG
ncbi:MAG TPA: helix-turn-helix domain-containing protein, partial [Thermoplasmata archaeon]|nr:helix-turn-helix domain-containing protein [Thermoplasmata archaeon]